MLARRARARGDRTACTQHTLRAVRLAIGRDGQYGPVLDCEPRTHSIGGFFACIAVTGAGRFFIKGVPARGREVAFWTAWQRGLVRTEGVHYRLIPPRLIYAGGLIGILLFPELVGLEQANRRWQYRRRIRRVVRAIADFNSDHILPIDSPFRISHVCDRAAVPSGRRAERLLGVDNASARSITATLRRIEPRWDDIRDRLYRSVHCLSHMDVGTTNIVLNQGTSILLDFGFAGAAPIGADLHTVRRYGGPAWSRDLVGTYAEVFAAKGVEVDPTAILRTLNAHFAARYRNLHFPAARNRETFDAALATSLALIGAPAD
jgi:hypothetical protein